MGKLITTIFGAGIFGTIISMRKYFGIVLVMVVSTMIFKADIVDYMKQSSKQQHEEKLAQINLETEKMKIEAEAKLKQELQEREWQEQARKEKEQKEKQEQERQLKIKQQQEKVQLENEKMKLAAQKSICDRYENDYKRQMFCSATPNHHTCASGYTPVTWYNGAMASRSFAIEAKCNVQY